MCFVVILKNVFLLNATVCSRLKREFQNKFEQFIVVKVRQSNEAHF